MSESHTEDGHPVLAATPARQGRFGKPVFWVLVVSTTLAALALLVAWGLKAPALHEANAKVDASRAAHATDFNAPQPAPVANPPPAR